MNAPSLSCRFVVVAACLGAAACSSATTVNDGGSDAVSDTAQTDTTLGDASDISDASDGSEAGVPCGTTVCSRSQVCCQATQQCYDPTCLACCMFGPDASFDVPGGDTGGDGGESDASADSGGGPCSASGACPRGLTCCSGACVNTTNDPRNCGSCGQSCSDPAPMCSGGTCTAQTCSPPCGTGFVCCEVNGPGPVGPPACYPGTTCPVGCPLCV